MTNFEKIMSEMTVEKVADFMTARFDLCKGCPLEASGCDYHKLCKENIKEWLNKEAEK